MTLLTKAAALKWLSWTAALVFNLTSLNFPPISLTPPLFTSCIVFCFGVQVFVCMFLRVSVYITTNNYYLRRIIIVTKIKWPRDARFSSCNDQTLAPRLQISHSETPLFQGLIKWPWDARFSSCNDQTLAPYQPQWNPSLLPSLHASSCFCIKKQEVGKAREQGHAVNLHLGRCVSDTVLVTGGLTAGFCMCPSSPLLLGSSKFIDHNHRNKQLLKVMSLSPWFPIMKGIVHSRY